MFLFRAIRDPERKDFLAAGHLRNPHGHEVKYFTATRDEAERQAYQDGPYYLVQAEIADAHVTEDMIVAVDGGLWPSSCRTICCHMCDKLFFCDRPREGFVTMVPSHADAIAEITLLPTEEGGRAEPTAPGSFACIVVADGRNFDVRFVLSGTERLSPGTTRSVSMRFLDPTRGRAGLLSRYAVRSAGEPHDRAGYDPEGVVRRDRPAAAPPAGSRRGVSRNFRLFIDPAVR